MDATQSKPWQSFLHELRSQGIEFDMVRHADEASRGELLHAMPALTPLDRAVISSTWAKMAAPQTSAPPAFTASSAYPADRTASPGAGVSSSGALASDLLHGAPVRHSVAADPSSLRAALSRGDSTVALPLASEMLQADPASLCLILHDYLPHMSVDGIRTVLGIGGHSAGTAVNAPLGAGPGSVDGTTLNGKPVVAGQVLTLQGLQSMYGAGCSVTCNGVPLSLPYTVQRADNILVRPLNERAM